ncbi:hypothetical protein ACXYTP_19225 [Tsukamurella ocularis]|uniref:hypothetical protein n=1 Tax=Tsukamurella ocularis TaxID=1970234 RepID=UPI0039EEE0C6
MTAKGEYLPRGERLDAPVCTTGCSEDVWHIKGGTAGDFPCVRCGWTVLEAMTHRAEHPAPAEVELADIPGELAGQGVLW